MEISMKKSKKTTLNVQEQSYIWNLSKKNPGNKNYGKKNSRKTLEPLRVFKKARPSFQNLGSIELEL